MTKIYRYLRHILEHEPNQLKPLLADIPVVHIIDRHLFLKGCRTNSLDCDIDLSLRPFFSILRAN
jgi:hypothetical protein